MYIFDTHIFWFHIAPTWYGLMYAISFVIGYLLMKKQHFNEKNLDLIFTATVLGVIIGGRLGYVLLYNPAFYFTHSLEILMPWKGGMSFHGGAIGVIVAWIICAQKMKTLFPALADKLVWIIPIGLFFGRIGNYINGELFGLSGYAGVWSKIINWVSKFPTPLLEASLEWCALFLILLWRRKNITYPWQVWVWFLGGYAIFRFVAEFFRDPDTNIWYLSGGWLTYGHVLSLVMFLFSVCLHLYLKKRKLTV